MDNIYKAVQLTIDSQNLALSKTPTHVYIANQYVDTNDTPLITAPFIIQKALENGTGVVDIVSSTIGSIYEVRLLCDAEVLISGYFYMPPMNAKFSELELYTSYPPRTPPVVNEFWQKTENFILEKTNTLLNFVQVFNSLSSMRLSLGYLEELLTTKKSNLVSAINEVYKRYEGVGDLYEKNVEAGAGANGWTDLLVTTHDDGTTQREVNAKTLKLAKSINDINAQIATNEKRTVYLDASLNTAIDLKDIDLIGSGYDNVITVAENSFGIQSSVTHPNWERRRLENLKIVGASRNNTVGFKFDEDTLAGRRHLNYVSFSNLDIAIKKPKGNIGNTYQNLNISQCNYGYVAFAEAGLKIHTGCDTFRDCQFDNVSKWAIDIDDNYGGAGQLAIYDSIFEYCTAGIRINLHNNLTFSPPIIKNCWFEEVANSSEISYGTFKTIETSHGTETARMIKLIDVPQIIIDGCFLANMELINSTVYAQNCRIDNSAFSGYPQFFIDANSRLYADNLVAFGTVHEDIIVRSVTARRKKTDTANSFSFRGEAPKGILNQALTSVNYIGRTYNGTAGTTVGIKERTYGDNALQATIVNGGCLNKTCLQLPLTVGDIAMLPSVSLTADKWAVWGVSIKSTQSGSMYFMEGQSGTSVLGTAIVDVGKWTHTWGVAQVGISAPVQLRIALSVAGNVYIENYFIAEFDTEKEAIDFANARMAILDN